MTQLYVPNDLRAHAALSDVLARHRDRLLSIPGCTAVGIAERRVQGERRDDLCVAVYVDQKSPWVSRDHQIPRLLDGFPTDVVQRRFTFRRSAVDPKVRHNTLHGGLAITTWEDSLVYGTLGCFIRTTGRVHLQRNIQIPAGTYLLTNHHVIQTANPATGADSRIIQPHHDGNGAIPDNYVIGDFVAGFRGPTDDCAIASLRVGRRWSNKVPSKPWVVGYNNMNGTGQPAVGQEVYKYGATTFYTKARITAVNFSHGHVRNAVYIEHPRRHLWAHGGDSGSVVLTTTNNRVVGLNFMEDTDCMLNNGNGAYAGLAYPIESQLNNFCNPTGSCTLA